MSQSSDLKETLSGYANEEERALLEQGKDPDFVLILDRLLADRAKLIKTARIARAFLRVHWEFHETPGVDFAGYASAVSEYIAALDDAVDTVQPLL